MTGRSYVPGNRVSRFSMTYRVDALLRGGAEWLSEQLAGTGGGSSHLRTGLRPQFPGNREKYREFLRFWHYRTILFGIWRVESMVCARIPYDL